MGRMKPIYLVFVDSDETMDIRITNYSNSSDILEDHLNTIMFEFRNEVDITDIQYFGVFDALSKVGGITSITNTAILVIVKYLVYKHWDQVVFKSISGDKGRHTKLNKDDWENLTSKVSFSNLFKLYDKVDNLTVSNNKLEY